ncbi:MAG: SUMF1/EgtB/PvdO family nonheme iron enzyme [Polyangiaceae bacterium]
MALVEGEYCRAVSQRCLERPKLRGAEGYAQCQRYAPSECLSKKREHLRVCMDRYEWPNRKGELPRTLTSWPEARELCASVGKRLCTEHEWQFACEGESMKPHVYGFERDPAACNFDRPYRQRTFNYAPWERCLADPACKAEYERLDQRKPAGSMPRCVSDHGVYDLNGNANEWVYRTDQAPPKRSGLKGGWWGPVRNRCRPMTTFHLEGDYGYEAGFRCCKDAPAGDIVTP